MDVLDKMDKNQPPYIDTIHPVDTIDPDILGGYFACGFRSQSLYLLLGQLNFGPNRRSLDTCAFSR